MTLVEDLDRDRAEHAFFFMLVSGSDPPTTLEELVGPRPAWMAEGACRGMGPDLFFPGQGGDVEAPRAICERCPVLPECLSYAMSLDGAPGVWGGTSARERERMRRASA